MRIVLLAMLLFWASSSWAQTPVDSLQQDSLPATTEAERFQKLGDSLKIKWRYALSENQWAKLDTSLHYTHDFAWGWAQESWTQNYGNLGHWGTPVFAKTWQYEEKELGPRLGAGEHLDRYRLRPKQLRIYEVEDDKALTNLYYSQINLKNLALKAELAQQYNKQLYYGIQYSVLSQRGYFNSLASQHRDLGLQLHYQKANYKGSLFVVSSSQNQSENGGLQDSVLQGLSNDFLETAETSLNEGDNDSPRQENRFLELLYRQNWKNWEHQLHYQQERFKFFDNNLATDSSFYGPLQVNNRGLRMAMQQQLIQNQLSYQLADIQLFLGHRLQVVTQEPLPLEQLNSLFAGASYQGQNLSASGQVLFGEQALDYQLKLRYERPLSKGLSAAIWGQMQQFRPSFLEQKAYLSGQEIWNNDFGQSQEANLGLGLSWKGQEGSLKAQYFLRQNPIIYNLNGQSEQLNSSLSLLQAELQQSFHYKGFYSDTRLVGQLQVGNEKYWPLPQGQLQQKLYFKGKYFRNASWQLGFRLRYQTAFYAQAYAPTWNQFYLQDQQLLQFYPQLDAFAVLKVYRFRIGLNYQNISYFWENQNYFSSYQYAEANNWLRLAVLWRLFN